MFSKRVVSISGRKIVVELNFLIRKTSSRWSKKVGKIIFKTIQFTQCPRINETPGYSLRY